LKTFKQKKEELAKLKDKLSRAKIVIFTTFAREGEKGLNVSAMRELKKSLKSSDSEYFVSKKTILDRALTQLPITTAIPQRLASEPGQANSEPSTRNSQFPINVFEYLGSLGMVFGYGDEQSVAKSIYGFAKKYPALKYFGAVWNGKFLDLTEFTEFAKLPGRDVLIARLLGMMKYPIVALAQVLDQIAKKK